MTWPTCSDNCWDIGNLEQVIYITVDSHPAVAVFIVAKPFTLRPNIGEVSAGTCSINSDIFSLVIWCFYGFTSCWLALIGLCRRGRCIPISWWRDWFGENQVNHHYHRYFGFLLEGREYEFNNWKSRIWLVSLLFFNRLFSIEVIFGMAKFTPPLCLDMNGLVIYECIVLRPLADFSYFWSENQCSHLLIWIFLLTIFLHATCYSGGSKFQGSGGGG